MKTQKSQDLATFCLLCCMSCTCEYVFLFPSQEFHVARGRAGAQLCPSTESKARYMVKTS